MFQFNHQLLCKLYKIVQIHVINLSQQVSQARKYWS